MNNTPICNGNHIHNQEQLDTVSHIIPTEDELTELAQIFKIFGDNTRIKILAALSAGELCVCDIAQLVGASQSTVSHQLRLLKAYRLVKCRRSGKGAYYSLDDMHVSSIINAGLEHVKEEDENDE
ncbi:ArsR/SmtB family transcription factor [Youxingia wuxianensis]|uniref:Winged helix-turn-helix transcriptional regulator n=1 Tax=Youxingia wuxianensis TaxID=2763678 RepID=A0A926IIS8_9FIRM|nr:metalloregulator ArsR/SmtB family transcription factor [Youxingia wuxianensis]MBC8586515.1 winged helix-turn-helix transcriptional regulator [Youxingia wuxianensis]